MIHTPIYFSIIIPVYNRPDEIQELLESLLVADFNHPYEIIIVEDGSTLPCKEIVENFKSHLNITYLYKRNSGPGDSRNFGMKSAQGNYFIIFDSDCIIPKQYLSEVEKELHSNFTDCFGGSDAALDSFSDIQKAINFSMTSFFTTGGIRGSSEKLNKFQPRSFNMGISKKAFEVSNGFGNIHPGEDPDLVIRLWKLGFETRLFSKAYVYHKRRINWHTFSTQINKFGKVRPILNHWHPTYSKWSFYFPTLFIGGLAFSIFLLVFNTCLPFFCYVFYFLLIFIGGSIQSKRINLKLGALSIIAVYKQFWGYGTGFLLSFIKIKIFKQVPEKAFPELFF